MLLFMLDALIMGMHIRPNHVHEYILVYSNHVLVYMLMILYVHCFACDSLFVKAYAHINIYMIMFLHNIHSSRMVKYVHIITCFILIHTTYTCWTISWLYLLATHLTSTMCYLLSHGYVIYFHVTCLWYWTLTYKVHAISMNLIFMLSW